MPITIELSSESERRLDALASQTGRDREFYLREIAERGLDEMEDYYLSIEILERVRKGEEPLYSSAEVREYLRDADMNSENGGGIPSLESLRAKEDGLRASGKVNLSVRMGRALSWTERGQKEIERDDPDAAFIFYWIGFDAICSGRPPHDNTKPKIDAFLNYAVGVDRSDSIYNVVIANESKTILTLAANAYVFKPFWDRYYKERKSPASKKWANSLIGSVKRTIANLECGADGTRSTLEVLFDCLTELRNQLVHGGSTWEDSANRDQVGDGARIMSSLLPVFLDLVMDNPDSFNADVGSPPPEMDSSQVIAEHNDYVRRLADKARNMANSEYREYLLEAIERELKENKPQ